MFRKKKPTLRGYFLTGLLALLPLLITVLVFNFVWNFTRSLVGPLMEGLLALAFPQVQGLPAFVPTLLGIVAVGLMIFITGLLIQVLFGRALFSLLDSMLGHVPLVSGLYQGVRQITRAFDGSGGSGLRQVVLIRPIRGGTYMVGFLTRKVKLEGKELSMVYVPTNTMYTGDIYLVPSREAVPLDMPVEEGVKLLVSGGLVAPSDWTVDRGGRRKLP